MPPTLPPLPPQPLPSHTSQASFVSALAMEEESSVEAEKTAEPGPVTRQPHVMACYQSYLAHYQVMLRLCTWIWLTALKKKSAASLYRLFWFDLLSVKKNIFKRLAALFCITKQNILLGFFYTDILCCPWVTLNFINVINIYSVCVSVLKLFCEFFSCFVINSKWHEWGSMRITAN